MEAVDCQPDFCIDLFEPSGHGRKRRAIADQNDNNTNALTEFTKFKENIEYSVMLPGEYDQMKYQDPDQCKNFILISGLLALLLTMSTILVSILFEIMPSSTVFKNSFNFSLARSLRKFKTTVEKPLMTTFRPRVMPDELYFNNAANVFLSK